MGLPQIMGSPPLGIWPVPGLQGACPREGTGAAPRLFLHLQQVPLGRVDPGSEDAELQAEAEAGFLVGWGWGGQPGNAYPTSMHEFSISQVRAPTAVGIQDGFMQGVDGHFSF